MILAKTQSDWLKKYLKEHGGEMTIALHTLVID